MLSLKNEINPLPCLINSVPYKSVLKIPEAGDPVFFPQSSSVFFLDYVFNNEIKNPNMVKFMANLLSGDNWKRRS